VENARSKPPQGWSRNGNPPGDFTKAPRWDAKTRRGTLGKFQRSCKPSKLNRLRRLRRRRLQVLLPQGAQAGYVGIDHSEF